MKKRLFALVLSLCMILSLVPQAAFAASSSQPAPEALKPAPTAEKLADEVVRAAGDELTVLAFTSDVHNGTQLNNTGATNLSATRLRTWLTNVNPKYSNKISLMGFCGDMAAASSNDSTFWTFTKEVMDVVDEFNIESVYTTGNHEYYNGKYHTTSNYPEVRSKYFLNEEALHRESDNYIMYCMGSNTAYSTGSSWGYEASQITALLDYLNGLGNDKPIIVLTHFPLHYYSSRTMANAADVISAVNQAAAGTDGKYGTSDDKKIVFLWGHNHTVGDDHYDQVYAPGDSISYSSSSSSKTELKFYYAGAGSMADTEYGSSGQVLGKGLVLTINSKNQLSFAYYDANGNNVTEGGTYTEQDPVAVESVAITYDATDVLERNSLQLGYIVQPSDGTVRSATWKSSNTSVASVDANGLVTGKAEGTATITLSVSDGVSSTPATDSIQINVLHNDNPVIEHTVSVTPSTSNPEESVSIFVGDTLIVNVTNGSSSNAYDFTATLSKTGVANNTGNSTVNIAKGGTGQFTFEGIANGTVDITIQNNSSYGSQYARKATIHLTVGEGGGSSTEDPAEGVTPESGKKYVILADDGYALTSEGDEVGYTNGSSGSEQYNYYGLTGEEYTVGENVAPDRLLWTFIASEDGKGFYIQSNTGKYLNGTYASNSTGGYDGRLKLDDTKDVWIISGASSSSTVNASILKSTNASQSDKGDKYLTHGNGSGTAAENNIFTLRSEDNATTTTFYEYTDDGTYVDPGNPDTPATGATVSGKVVSFSAGENASKTVSLKLFSGSSQTAAYSITVEGTEAQYSFKAVAAGSYTLEVSKENHVTRTYQITVAEENVALEVLQINLIGDINGDGQVRTSDVMIANLHAQGVRLLEGYRLACANVAGDDAVTTVDVGRLNSHARRVSLLW